MKCKDLVQLLEETWPSSYALDWDNVGLLVGDLEQEVNHIYVALDLTCEVLEDALEQKADFIITHHPLLFSGIKRVTSENFIQKKVLKLIENRISCYGIHTNYDVLSMADHNSRMLKLKEKSPLMTTIISDDNKLKGIGCVGEADKERNLKEYAKFVKAAFLLPKVLYYGPEDKGIKKVAVSGGSGKSMIKDALQKKADVLVTGDIDYHNALDALEQGLCIIDAGHYGTEYIFVEEVAKVVKEKVNGVKITRDCIRHPYKCI